MPQMLARRGNQIRADQHAVGCGRVQRERAFVARLHPCAALIGEIGGAANRAVLLIQHGEQLECNRPVEAACLAVM